MMNMVRPAPDCTDLGWPDKTRAGVGHEISEQASANIATTVTFSLGQCAKGES